MTTFENWKNSIKFPSFIDLPIKNDTPLLFYFLFGTTTLALTYITLLDDDIESAKTTVSQESAFSMLPSIPSAVPVSAEPNKSEFAQPEPNKPTDETAPKPEIPANESVGGKRKKTPRRARKPKKTIRKIVK